jgi:acyl dehydratase
MPLDPSAVGSSSDPTKRTWNSKDALLYALGVGAGALDPTGFELDLTTENSDGVAQRVLPTFTTIVGQGAGGGKSIGDFDPAMLVHAEQSIRLHGELPTDGSVSNVTTVAGMYDKGKAGLVVLETASHYDDGTPAFTTRTTMFIRGEGGWGGPRGPEGDTEAELAALPLPAREPDEVVTYSTRPDQALLYRLSGDRNPLHSDPTFAKRAGFDQPILHGLCTYGFTGRGLFHVVCGSDPSRFGAMRARFSKPTLPGDTLTISVWDIGAEAEGFFRFRTENQRGETVIDSGLFQLA